MISDGAPVTASGRLVWLPSTFESSLAMLVEVTTEPAT